MLCFCWVLTVCNKFSILWLRLTSLFLILLWIRLAEADKFIPLPMPKPKPKLELFNVLIFWFMFMFKLTSGVFENDWNKGTN